MFALSLLYGPVTSLILLTNEKKKKGGKITRQLQQDTGERARMIGTRGTIQGFGVSDLRVSTDVHLRYGATSWLNCVRTSVSSGG